MPRKERCKRLRTKQLNETASGIPKLSTFGFVKTPGNSSKTQDSNYSTTNLHAEDFSSHSHESNSPSPDTVRNAATERLTSNLDAQDSSLHSHESDSSDITEKPPDLPLTHHQSTSAEKLASNLSQEVIQSAESTIVDNDSETDISKSPFVITSASPITRKSTCSPDPKVSSTSGSQLGCESICCTQSSPYKPTSKELQKTSVKQICSDGKNRQCPSSIFSKYSWITYCLTRGTIACFFCKTAGEKQLNLFSYHSENAFSSGNFSNWKKCQEKLEKHQNSHYHQECVEKCLFLKNANMNVGVQLEKQCKDEKEFHRFLFLKQLSSLKYLVRQGLAIRGHESMESKLIQMLKTRAEDVPELNQWIEDRRYISPDIINELVEMMGNAVLRSILQDIKENLGLFGLIADESRDISNKEQLTCILRWVSLPDLTTHEDFLGMYLIEKPDAETIKVALKDILLRCNLRLNDCRWQAYDGASTMSGHLSGVGARIQAENPAAHRIHCANHRLDLALKSCTHQSEVIDDSLSFVQDLAVFIRRSPLRMATYESIAKELDPDESVDSLHLLCPTRWTVRTKSIAAVLNNYQTLHSTLLSISKTASEREKRDKAAGLATKMTEFKTFFGLHFAMNLFCVCEQLATTMQTKGILAQTVMVGVRALKDNLQLQRDSYNVFFDQTQEKGNALGMVKEAVLPRPRKVPRRLQDGDAEEHQHDSVKSMFRAQYCEAIDAILAELNRRFDERSYAPLQHIEDVILNAANREPCDISDDFKGTYDNEIDFDQVTTELRFLPGIIKQCLPEVRRVTTMDTVISAVTQGQNGAFIVPNIVRLLQIYLLAPMSAATAERSFSGQRRIKTYLRSTMTQKRYNNLLMLNIHKERIDSVDLRELAKAFAEKNDKRIRFFGKFH